MTILLSPDMTKRKAEPKAKAESNRKPLVIQVRAGDEWKAWAEKVARKDGRSLAALVERALMVYARQIGVVEEPPER